MIEEKSMCSIFLPEKEKRKSLRVHKKIKKRRLFSVEISKEIGYDTSVLDRQKYIIMKIFIYGERNGKKGCY